MTTTNNETNSVANVIAKQIGGHAFTMIGAKNLVAVEDGLQFKVGTNSKKVTHVRVTLDYASDLYVVETYRVRGVNSTCLETQTFVHVESLNKTIEAMTGLYLSL